MFFEPISLENIRAAFPNWAISEQSQLKDKEATEAELNVKCFDQCVDYLRKDFPDRQTNENFTLLWRLIGNKLGIGVMQMSGIEELHIAAVGKPPMTLIALPVNFYRKFLESPVYHMAATVFVGHQALALSQEMTSDRWTSLDANFAEQIMQNALREEGRFLVLYKKHQPSFVPNSYQQQLMDAVSK